MLEVLVVGATEAAPPVDLPRSGSGVHYRFADDGASIRAHLPHAEVILHWDPRTEALRDAWPVAAGLRWMHVAGVGADWYLFPELVASDVVVTNCRGIFDESLPEYVLALMLALAKDIPATVRDQDARRWRHRPADVLRGRRAVVLGAGSIGRAIARLLLAVGMRVDLVARRAHPPAVDLPPVQPIERLPHILPDADWLVTIVPLTDATRGLIGPAELARLPARARLVNVGRGPVVQEEALLAALHSGGLAGAALDVFDTEPLPPGHPLWAAPGVLVSPHIGGDVAGWMGWFTRSFLENLERYRAGLPLRDVLDKQAGYVVETIEGGAGT